MKVNFRFFSLLILIFSATLLTGCIEKTFKPEAILEVTSLSPYELIPTATDTASLPTTSITVTSINTIPCNLKSFSVSYLTKFGEVIPSLAIPTTQIETKLAAGGSIDVVVKPYTARVLELFELSGSDISPIRAQISLVFKDYNDNLISREANCLLYKPDI